MGSSAGGGGGGSSLGEGLFGLGASFLSKDPRQKRFGGGPATRLKAFFAGFESLLQPRTGKKGKRRLGEAGRLQRSISRQNIRIARQLAPQFQALRQSLIEGDPLASQAQALQGQALQTALGGLEGLDEGLPADIQRGLQEQIRSRFSRLGTLDSPGAAIGEIIGEIGLGEQIRGTRLAQAMAILRGSPAPQNVPGIGGFSPAGVLNPGAGLQAAIPGLVGAASRADLATNQLGFLATQQFNEGLGAAFGQIGAGLFGGSAASTPQSNSISSFGNAFGDTGTGSFSSLFSSFLG